MVHQIAAKNSVGSALGIVRAAQLEISCTKHGRGGQHRWSGARSQPALLLCLLSILLCSQPLSAQPGTMPPLPPLGFFGGLLDAFGIGSSPSPSPPTATRTMTPVTASSVTSPPATIATSSDLSPLRTPAATVTPVPDTTIAAKPAVTPAPVAAGAVVPVVTAAPATVPSVPATVVPVPVPVVTAAATPVTTVAPANALPIATPAATPAAVVIPPPTIPTPVPTPAGATVVITPAGTRLVPVPPQMPPLRPPIPVAASPPPPVPASRPPAQPPPPPPLAMVPLPAALAPLLAPPSKSAARSPAPSPPAPYVVRDLAATALAAELLLQGPGVWPFDAPKQALLIGAIGSMLPGLGPNAVSITGSGAPFRRRLLQESALVETQIDAGSADRVPLVREQLQNATSSGLLQSTLRSMGLRVTGVQLQAATAVVPAVKDSSGGMTSSAIVGLCVAAFVAVLLSAGAYYVCVHRQCLSWSNRVAAAVDAEQPKGAATPKEGTRVKPFYEAPQFAQTYARAPSLVQERPPLHPALQRGRSDGGQPRRCT